MSKASNTIHEYGIPSLILDDDKFIKTDNPIDDDEIMLLVNIAYTMADEISPTGKRTPNDIDKIEQLKNQLNNEMLERKREEEQDNEHSKAWQIWAEQQRKKRELPVKREQMNRLRQALQNPEVTDLLLKVMNHQFTPQQAFNSINAIPNLKKQMLSLTSKRTRKGGKSRIFRRKNKKMTSTSKQKTRGTRRHRKSSTRRSTRK